MSPYRIDKIIFNYRWIMLGGAVLIALSSSFDCPGVIAGTMAVALGASGGSFRQWRTEAGLWMLSTLFLVFFSLICAAFAYARITDFLQQGLPLAFGSSLDFSIGGLVLWEEIRFLFSVTRLNRRLACGQ
jgi:hypothetical protein